MPPGTESGGPTDGKDRLTGRHLKQYEFLSRIGVGGMGEVYKAHDHNLGRDVAIKVLAPEYSADPERLGRLRLEARTLAALNHPGIAAIYDVQEEHGVCGLVLELVEGETLAERIARGPLPAADAIAIARQVAEAVEAAHGKGVVHRDLKPANIKITPDGRVKVLDFGLAKLTAPPGGAHPLASSLPTMLTSEALLGTPSYMSPEQATGKPADARTDVWALGCILYEVFSGTRPFTGKNTTDVLAGVLEREPDWQVLSGARNGVGVLVQRCLKKNPAERIRSVTEVRAVLEALATGCPARRWPYAAAAIAAAALALAMIYVLVPAAFAPAGKPGRLSVAVLPLVARSATGEAPEAFADSVTDTLISELGELGAGLRVISLPTMMKYKNTLRTTPEIAEALAVDFLVEGSVDQSQGKVRIRISLIPTPEDSASWTETYERDYEDVFALQRQLARDIAVQIGFKLTPESESRLARIHKVVPEAYDAYLKGLRPLASRDPIGSVAAMESFELAVKIDPTFAAGYAGLAKSYANMAFSSVMSPEEGYEAAREAAQKALDLDPTNAEARIVLARVRVDRDWDFRGAEAEYKRIIETYPSKVSVYGFYAELLTALGRLDEALKMNRRSIEFDPESTEDAFREGWILHLSRKPEESIASWTKAMELQPSSGMILSSLAEVYDLAGRHHEAVDYFQQAFAAGGIDERTLAAWDATYRSGGFAAYVRKYLEFTAADEERTGNYYTYTRARLHARLGETDEALAWLERAYKERHNRLIFLKVEPYFDSIRPDPRFVGLMQRVGLVQ